MLEVRGLEAGYGSARVLHGVHLKVGPGEVVALLGRNGMGKTTTVRCIMGLLRPSGGSVRFSGQELAGRPSYRIARLGLGLVPEGRQVFPNLTVRENLEAFARGRQGDGPWTTPAVFRLLPGLAARAHSRGVHLSGGEQQMLAIGRALMTNPKLLILDEATEGLAPLIRNEIWRCLATLKAHGQSILLIDKPTTRWTCWSTARSCWRKGGPCGRVRHRRCARSLRSGIVISACEERSIAFRQHRSGQTATINARARAPWEYWQPALCLPAREVDGASPTSAPRTVGDHGPREVGGSIVSETERLITEQIPRLRRYARALLSDPVRADDLVQECLLRALSRRHLWQPGTDIRAWMFTILHNIHVNNQRRNYVRTDDQELLDNQPELAAPASQEKNLEIRDLARALRLLPEPQRQVVLLVGLEGMDYKHVAAMLEIPIGTVMSRLHRGREALRRLMAYGPAPRSSDQNAKLRLVP